MIGICFGDGSDAEVVHVSLNECYGSAESSEEVDEQDGKDDVPLAQWVGRSGTNRDILKIPETTTKPNAAAAGDQPKNTTSKERAVTKRAKRRANSSGGIHYNERSDKWKAQMQIRGVYTYIGYFATRSEAELAVELFRQALERLVPSAFESNKKFSPEEAKKYGPVFEQAKEETLSGLPKGSGKKRNRDYGTGCIYYIKKTHRWNAQLQLRGIFTSVGTHATQAEAELALRHFQQSLQRLVPSAFESRKKYSPEEVKIYRPLFERSKRKALSSLRKNSDASATVSTLSDPDDHAKIPKSPVQGVTYSSNNEKWLATPQVHGQPIDLGQFDSQEQAELTVVVYRRVLSKVPAAVLESGDKFAKMAFDKAKIEAIEYAEKATCTGNTERKGPEKVRLDIDDNSNGSNNRRTETDKQIDNTKKRSRESKNDEAPPTKKIRDTVEHKNGTKMSTVSNANIILNKSLSLKSTVDGVCFCPEHKKWVAAPYLHGHQIDLGQFDSQAQAEFTVLLFRKIVSQVPGHVLESGDKFAKIAFEKAKNEAIEYSTKAMSKCGADLKTPAKINVHDATDTSRPAVPDAPVSSATLKQSNFGLHQSFEMPHQIEKNSSMCPMSNIEGAWSSIKDQKWLST